MKAKIYFILIIYVSVPLFSNLELSEPILKESIEEQLEFGWSSVNEHG